MISNFDMRLSAQVVVGRIYDDFDTNAKIAVSFLQDGQFVDNLGPQVAVERTNAALFNHPGFDVIGFFNYLVDPGNPGTHSYCLTIMTGGRFNDTGHLINDSYTGSNFYAVEVK